jgi:hypothetical protein
MTAQTVVAAGGSNLDECWCCGQPPETTVRLGNHPEVSLCPRCAHFLHRQARAREDALAPSPAARFRAGLRSARAVVIRQGWHLKPVIGRPLRWLGRHLP